MLLVPLSEMGAPHRAEVPCVIAARDISIKGSRLMRSVVPVCVTDNTGMKITHRCSVRCSGTESGSGPNPAQPLPIVNWYPDSLAWFAFSESQRGPDLRDLDLKTDWVALG